MLYEAKDWFYQTGNANVLEIASAAGIDVPAIRAELKSIKKRHPLGGVDAFASFRNKVGHHYDPKFVKHLYKFSVTDSRNFHEILINYARYANDWTALCKRVIVQAAKPKA